MVSSFQLKVGTILLPLQHNVHVDLVILHLPPLHYLHSRLTMKLSISLLCTTAISGTSAFIVQPTQYATSSISLNAEPEKFKAVAAEIRGPTEKNAVLEFGWDGTTALGGAVVDSQPARMLDEILENGETQSEACELFNANLGKFIILYEYVSCMF